MPQSHVTKRPYSHISYHSFKMLGFKIIVFFFSFFFFFSFSLCRELQAVPSKEYLNVKPLSSPTSFNTDVQHAENSFYETTQQGPDEEKKNPPPHLQQISFKSDDESGILSSNPVKCHRPSFPHPIHKGACLLPIGPPSNCPHQSLFKENVCREIVTIPGMPVCPENSTFIRPGACFLRRLDTECTPQQKSPKTSETITPSEVCLYPIQNISIPYCPHGHLLLNGRECIQEFSPSITRCPRGYRLESIHECVRETYLDPIHECNEREVDRQNNVCYSLRNSKALCSKNSVYNILSGTCMSWVENFYQNCPEGYDVHPDDKTICYRVNKTSITAVQTYSSASCPDGFTESQTKNLCVASPVEKKCPNNTIYSPLYRQKTLHCLFPGSFQDTCPVGYEWEDDQCFETQFTEPSCPDHTNCYRETKAFFTCPKTSNEVFENGEIKCYPECENSSDTQSCDPQENISPIPNCPKGFVYDGKYTCFRALPHICERGSFDPQTKLCKTRVPLSMTLNCSPIPDGDQAGQQKCTRSYRTDLVNRCSGNAYYNSTTDLCEISKNLVSSSLKTCPEGWKTTSDGSSCLSIDLKPRPVVCPENYTRVTQPLSISKMVSAFVSHNMLDALEDLFIKIPLNLLIHNTEIKNWCQKDEPLLHPMDCEAGCRRCPEKSVLLDNKCLLKERVSPIHACSDPSVKLNTETQTCTKITPAIFHDDIGVLLKPVYRCPQGAININDHCIGLSFNFTFPFCGTSQERYVNDAGTEYCFKTIYPS